MGHAELSLDSVIAERFDVVELGGQGGMSTVYRALHRGSGERVALKIMPATDESRRRFAREAAALENVQHPCIVRYREHGELGDGRVFLAMEWVEGESLGARLRRGRVPLGDTLVLGAKLARALAAVHAAGLVHRDVKPGNVMLRDGDATQPVLLDFGLVKPVVGEEITSVGLAVGTPGYMAPEQARGSSRLDARADIFGLACLLYRCATGERPFPGADVTAILTKLLFDTPASMRKLEPRVTPELDALVAAMLEKNPDDRPREASEIARALEQLAAREAPSAPRIAEAQALTPDEQLPVSVVVVAEAAPDAPTIAGESAAALLARQPAALVVESSEVLLRPAPAPLERGAAVALAESLGGVAETLANGALVVVFSGSTNARDQCMRAARCALRLRALAPDKVVSLASGRAHTSGGSLVGEAIDRAVMGLRGPSEEGVNVDGASVQLLEPRFEVDGRRLKFERSEGLTARTLLGAPTPCVGRDTELRAVMGALDQCIEDGGARVVAITADAGVGKSRLAAEAVTQALAAHPGMGVWLARGDALFERSPLAVAGKMLRELAGLAASDPPQARRARLRARVAEHVAAEDVLPTAEFLGEICGVAFDDDGRPALRAARSDPQLMANQLKAAFERFVVAEAEARPLMIVVEDLHWADALSISYLQKTAMRLATSSMLLLLLSRPEGEDRFPGLFTEATHLRMRPLTARAATKLAQSVLGDAPAKTIERVVELAGGNAFYLEELIRAVAERQGELPETVVLMAQARLQALDAEARRVLRAASVFGEAFTEHDVAALEGGEAAARWLGTLVDREVLVRARAGDGGAFSFRHALLREAAYASLTDEDRLLGHRLAARRLETRGDRNAMNIADHYVRGGEPAAAVSAYVRAAEQALEAGDFEAPGVVLERARACGAAGAALGRLEGLAARAAWQRGDMAASERLGRDALTRLPPGEPSWYEVIADLGNALQGRLDYAGIEQLARMLVAHPARPVGASYARAMSLCYTLLIQTSPDSPLSRELTLAIDAVAGTAANDALVEARLAVARAFGAVVRRHPSAVKLFELAARRLEEVGNGEIARMQRNSQATALGWLGAWEEAVSVVTAVTESAGRAYLWTRVTLAWSLAQLGRLDEATTTLERVLAAGGDDAFLIVESQLTLARVELLRGRAGAALARVVACLQDSALPKGIVVRLHATAFEAAAGDAEVARTHGAAVEAGLAEGVPLVEDAVYVRLIAALSKLQSHDRDGARAVLSEAQALVLDYAALIEDAAGREQFLVRVRENARVLELAREMLAGADG